MRERSHLVSHTCVGKIQILCAKIFLRVFFNDHRQQPDGMQERQSDVSYGCPAGEEGIG